VLSRASLLLSCCPQEPIARRAEAAKRPTQGRQAEGHWRMQVWHAPLPSFVLVLPRFLCACAPLPSLPLSALLLLPLQRLEDAADWDSTGQGKEGRDRPPHHGQGRTERQEGRECACALGRPCSLHLLGSNGLCQSGLAALHWLAEGSDGQDRHASTHATHKDATGRKREGAIEHCGGPLLVLSTAPLVSSTSGDACVCSQSPLTAG
jgi:hypothetical protein